MPLHAASPAPQPAPTFLTIDEVADLLRVNPWTVRDWIKRGFVPYFRIGRTLRIDRADLERWLAQRKEGGA